jgi:hypothetical protein
MGTNSTQEIKKAIKSTLLTVCPRVFYEDAPKGSVTPYFVFNLHNSRSGEKTEVYLMDLDGWDDKSDTTALENLMFSAHEAIQNKVFSAGSIGFYPVLEGKFTLKDPDVRIKRRKYTYQIRSIGGI